MFFSPKRDFLHGSLIWGTNALAMSVLVADFSWFAFIFLAPVIILFCWFWFGTGYIITKHELIAKIGPIKYTVLLEEINCTRKTKNLWSSAALSYQRIEIRYGRHNQYLYVSPNKEDEFIKLLKN